MLDAVDDVVGGGDVEDDVSVAEVEGRRRGGGAVEGKLLERIGFVELGLGYLRMVWEVVLRAGRVTLMGAFPVSSVSDGEMIGGAAATYVLRWANRETQDRATIFMLKDMGIASCSKAWGCAVGYI